MLILGGFRYSTIEVEIYRQAVTLFDLPMAAALSIGQMVAVTTLLAVYARRQERTASPLVLAPEASTRRRPEGRTAWAVAVSVVATLTALFVPPAVLVYRAAADGGFRRLFVDEPVLGRPLDAVPTSLSFAVAATAVAVVVGMCAAYVISRRPSQARRGVDVAARHPAVTIGFGFLIALDWPIDLRHLALVPRPALVAVPVVGDGAADVVSISVQAAPCWGLAGRVFRYIDLPIVARAAGGRACVVSLGELAPPPSSPAPTR